MGRIADIHTGLARTREAVAAGEHVPYAGAPIHDGSPVADVRAALAAAQTHPVAAVREILVARLSARLADMVKVAPAPTVRMYAPGRVIHTVTVATGRALCARGSEGLHRMPADPWARVGAEAGTSGPCMRCLTAELASR